MKFIGDSVTAIITQVIPLEIQTPPCQHGAQKTRRWRKPHTAGWGSRQGEAVGEGHSCAEGAAWGRHRDRRVPLEPPRQCWGKGCWWLATRIVQVSLFLSIYWRWGKNWELVPKLCPFLTPLKMAYVSPQTGGAALNLLLILKNCQVGLFKQSSSLKEEVELELT